tara:strand:+ start:512 stop:613 length:102 start_codon:yes stop_codon:yes gene_type:complete
MGENLPPTKDIIAYPEGHVKKTIGKRGGSKDIE